MLKKITAIFLILSLTLCFWGCGKIDDQPPVKETESGTKPSTNPTEGNADTEDPENIRSLSRIELNYFYVDAINEYVNQYGAYLPYLGLDYSTPLSQQIHNKDTGTSWADYFLDAGIETAKNIYALYDEAVKAGHKLSDEEQAAKQSLYDNMDIYAKHYGFDNTDDYLKSIYGKGANTNSYKAYYEVVLMASSYYATYAENLKNSYTDTILREFEGSESYKYNSYSYYTYYLALDKCKFGGTQGADGKITYSDAELKAAEEYIEKVAKLLSNPEINTIDKLNAAIKHMEIQLEYDKNVAENGSENTPAPDFNDDDRNYSKATEVTDKLYSGVSSLMQEWLRDSARQEGDITSLKYTSTSTDSEGKKTKTLNGIYIVLFKGVNDNQFPLANVRHILVKFEGGTTDRFTGQTIYTQAEMDAAKNEATRIYDEWLNGERTEDSFAALAQKYTDDGNGDVGGIYYDIYPGQMVTTFNDWCFDKTRETGDHGVVQTDYGWHVMFYSGDSDITYRNFRSSNDKLEIDIDAWQNHLLDSYKLDVPDTTQVNMDYIIGEE